MISGIIQVLKSGGRWIDAPEVYGPRKTLYNRFLRWAAKGVWSEIFHALATPADLLHSPDRLLGREGASMCIWRQRGEHKQAIGRSRGGRTTKIHALTDGIVRPVAFLLTGGQIADCTAGASSARTDASVAILHGDKGYDSDAIRRQVEAKGRVANIPPKANRKWKNCFSPVLYRGRNAIERMFCRLKDFRRIATRYDRLATTSSQPSASLQPSATGYESRP